MTWLVAGLGNPGEVYARTRHNAGAMVVEALARRFDRRLRRVRFLPAEAAEVSDPESGERIILARSAQFMNVSGPAFASLAKRSHLSPHQVLAAHDDIDLPFGRLQLKRGGSTAGHHGLDSLVSGFRSPDFFRLRLGVGRPPGRQDPADFVLEPLSKREQEEIGVMVEDGVDAVLTLIREGLNAAQDRFNRATGSRGR